MKCLDYRRVLLAGTGETQEMRDHRLECVFCTDLHKEHAAFEDQLREALEVPVPAALADRLVTAVPDSGHAAAFNRWIKARSSKDSTAWSCSLPTLSISSMMLGQSGASSLARSPAACRRNRSA